MFVLECLADKFRNLKSYFYRILNTKTKSGADGDCNIDRWPHFNELKFLNTNVTPMRSISNFDADEIVSCYILSLNRTVLSYLISVINKSLLIFDF